MGKGDKKTRKGKINRGSHGKLRPKKSNKVAATVAEVPTKQTATKTKEVNKKPAKEKSLADDKKP